MMQTVFAVLLCSVATSVSMETLPLATDIDDIDFGGLFERDIFNNGSIRNLTTTMPPATATTTTASMTTTDLQATSPALSSAVSSATSPALSSAASSATSPALSTTAASNQAPTTTATTAAPYTTYYTNPTTNGPTTAPTMSTPTTLPRITTTSKPLPFNVSFTPNPPMVDRLSVDAQTLRCEVDKLTPDEVHITSIVVQRTNLGLNETYALITAYAAAHVADVNDTTVTVSGDVNPSHLGEYLEIRWANPAEAMLGTYFCEVFGLDGLGHPISIIEKATVSAPAVGLDDVINIVMSLQRSQKNLQDQIASLTASCGSCSGKRLVEEEVVKPLGY